MKRLHVHVAVHDIQQSIRFYSALFAAAPTVLKDDYAKWQLDDPRVNFAISKRSGNTGIDHLGMLPHRNFGVELSTDAFATLCDRVARLPVEMIDRSDQDIGEPAVLTVDPPAFRARRATAFNSRS